MKWTKTATGTFCLNYSIFPCKLDKGRVVRWKIFYAGEALLTRNPYGKLVPLTYSRLDDAKRQVGKRLKQEQLKRERHDVPDEDPDPDPFNGRYDWEDDPAGDHD